MPPHATRRLNLVLVPGDWDRPPRSGALEHLQALLEAKGYILSDGRAGPRAPELISGSFALFRVDRPLRYGVYGNRVGGFHVRCPACAADIPKPWGKAVEGLRAQGEWVLQCPACQVDIGPAGALTIPEARVARFALEFRDVGSADLRRIPEFDAALGPDWGLVYLRG